MKTFFLVLALFPTDTLPEKVILLNAIDSFYQIQTEAQLLEFQTSNKGEWLKYLPSIGLTYTLDGQPLPTISLSSTLLYRARKDRQALTAKRQAIVEVNRLAAQKAKLRLATLLYRYEGLRQEIRTRKEILDIDRKLFEMDAQRYQELRMAPSDFLKAKKVFLERQQAFQQLQFELGRLEQEILSLSIKANEEE